MQRSEAFSTRQSPLPRNNLGAAPPLVPTTRSEPARGLRKLRGEAHALLRYERQMLAAALAAQQAQLERMRAELRAARGIIAEHQRVQHDLAMAQQIQRQMLPAVFPDIPGLALAAMTRPAQGVGGDLYDVVRLDTHRVALLLGDVAGKGIPAALEMARLLGDFRACVRVSAATQDVIQTLNRWWCQRHTRVSTFVTVQYVVLDLAAHCMQFICAGPPLFCAAGRMGTWSPWAPPRTSHWASRPSFRISRKPVRWRRARRCSCIPTGSTSARAVRASAWDCRACRRCWPRPRRIPRR